jgi:ABC-2 type transport system ATP-binding protein
VGYLTQTFSLYQDLSVHENLRYVGELRRVPRQQIDERGMRYLRMFGMDRFTQRLAGRLSGGMKQKLALACALIAEPRILLLDEPTTGVDPVSRREFWQALTNLAENGMTVVVATPYLDEAERCRRVALMHDGVLQKTGTPAELRSSLGLHRLELRAEDLQGAEAALAEAAAKDAEGIHDAQRFGDRLDVMVKDADAGERLVRQTLPGEVDLRRAEPTLENTFVSLLKQLGGEIPEADFPSKEKPRGKSDEAAIGASDLVKRFGDFEAVKNVNIAVKYGEIYGLLGANGAGKTTTIKMLCGLSTPTSGTTELAGVKGQSRSSKVRGQVGYMSQKFSLYDEMTIAQNLDFFAGVYGVPEQDREEKKAWVLRFSGLEGKGDQITGSLPGGWKQRVAFGAAIMHEPAVLFLDEPTSGVDPLARRGFWRMINALADRGTAVLVTTHYLEEAEQCNRLGFMVAGELVAEGSPTDVKRRIAADENKQPSDYSLEDVFIKLVERSRSDGAVVNGD